MSFGHHRQDKQGVGHDVQKEITPDFERQRFEEASLEGWFDQIRSSPSADGEALAALADRLGVLIEWLCDRQDPEYIAVRAWVLCYFCRPQIIHYETCASFAKRMDKTTTAIIHHMREFQALFPGVRFPMRPGGGNRKPNAVQNKRRYQQVKRLGASDFHWATDQHEAELRRKVS